MILIFYEQDLEGNGPQDLLSVLGEHIPSEDYQKYNLAGQYKSMISVEMQHDHLVDDYMCQFGFKSAAFTTLEDGCEVYFIDNEV